MHDIEVAPLSREEAVLLTNQIAKALTLSWDLIVRAYHGHAWEALGYKSWDEYCRGEFGHARLALPAEERRENVRSLREQGLSVRAIAAVTGSSRSTTERDLAGVPNGTPERITGIDGKSYGSTVVDAEIVEETDVEVREVRTTRAPLPKQFQRPVENIHRGARRVAELGRDDRFTRNVGVLADMYLPRLVEARDALTEVIAALEKGNGAVH